MLDGRPGGGMSDSAQSDYGSDNGGGYSEPPRRSGGGGSRGGGSGFDKKLDDEIPF
jgi:hypothetical protein